ncbi:MAG: hypothetical protein ACRD9L_21125, partial [Bryobacteraceae bacterium]
MPIDSNIPLQVQVPQPQNPLDSYGKILQLKQLLASRQLNQQIGNLKLQEAQQGIADEQSLRSLFGNTPNPTPQQIYGTIGPTKGAAVVKSLNDNETAALTRRKTALENAFKQAEFIGQQLGGVKDQPSYDAALANLKAQGLDTSQMTPQFDQGTVQGYIDKGTSIKDRLSAEHDNVMEGFRKTEVGNDTSRLNAQLPGLNADSAQKVRANDASVLAAAASQGPDAFQAALAALPYGRAKPFEGLAKP